MNLKPILSISLLSLASASALASFSVKPYTATYGLFHNNSEVAKTTKQLSISNGQYTFSASTQLHILFVKKQYHEISQGSVTANGLQPKSYALTEGNTTKFSYNHFTPNLQDDMSQALTLRNNLIQHKFSGSIKSINQDGTQTINYTSSKKTQPLKTAIGTVQTVLVSYTDKKGNTIKDWLAPKYQYLPVQTNIYHNDKLSAKVQVLSYSK